jgi:uncharacterized protein
MRRFDLRSLKFHDASEVWRRLPVEVEPFVFGGLEYAVPEDKVDVELTAARVGDNLTLTAEFETDVIGPCQRCLADADVRVEARGVDYVRHGDSEGGSVDDEDEEGDGYASNFALDVERWVRDLVAEALPAKILCHDDCRGLCPVCGADLNADPAHSHDEP